MANSKMNGGSFDRSTMFNFHEDISMSSTGDTVKLTEREETHGHEAGYGSDFEDLPTDSTSSQHETCSSSEESDFEDDDWNQMPNDIDQNNHVKKQKFINEAVEDEMEIRSLRKMLKALRKAAAVGVEPTHTVTAHMIKHNENSREKDGLNRPSSSSLQGITRAVHQQAMQHLSFQCRDHYGPRPQDLEAARAMREDYEHPVIALPELNASVPLLPRAHDEAEEPDTAAISESEQGDNDEQDAAQLVMNQNASSAFPPLPARLDEQLPSPCKNGLCGTCPTCSCSIASLVCAVSSNFGHPKQHQHCPTLDDEASLHDMKINAMIEGVPSLILDKALELSTTPRLVTDASSSLRIVHANASLVALYSGWLKKIDPYHDEKKADLNIVGQRLSDVFDVLSDNFGVQNTFAKKSRNALLHLGIMKKEIPAQGASVSIFPVSDVLTGNEGIMSSGSDRKRKRRRRNPMKSLKIAMRSAEEKPSHLLIQFNCTPWLEPLAYGASSTVGPISNANPGFRMVG